MNIRIKGLIKWRCFLSGVCRHELNLNYSSGDRDFLSGVCRHELLISLLHTSF
ncbi:hypothetical protein J500_1405 [Acinetobacter sp. 479375]|nr:hypothetical protein J500_1405 [Acinetobacter sp. 479375]